MSYEISRGSCVLAAGIVPAIPLIPQHPPTPGYSPLHFTEENSECQKAKRLAQSHQVSQLVTEPEFKPTSAWNQSLGNVHEITCV